MFVEPYPRRCAERERFKKIVFSIGSIEEDPLALGVKLPRPYCSEAGQA